MEQIKEYIQSRLQHPFLGTFTIALLIANWKIILIATTGSLEPKQRIDAILELPSNLQDSLIYPSLFAVIFVMFYPALNMLVNLFFHWIQINENNNKARLHESFDYSSDKKYSQVRAIAINASKDITSICGEFESNISYVTDEKLRAKLRDSMLKCKELAGQLRANVNSEDNVKAAYRNIQGKN